MAFSSLRRQGRRLLPALAALAIVGSSSPAAAEREGVLDPSEEITPEELASIPEPPGTSPRPARSAALPPKAESATPRAGAPPPTTDIPPPNAAPEASEPRSTGTTITEPSPARPAPAGPWIWRVQILATPDRSLADRVAREAADRLGTLARVDSEPPLHKVRLGAFTSEADAQVLKQRAVEMGYPGAFRIKMSTARTDE